MIVNGHLHASAQCRRLIKRFEKAPKDWPQTADGAALLAYLCPSGQWTLGFGCSFWENGDPVKEGDELFDEARIERLLAANLKSAEDYVKAWVRVPLNQYQFDALVSFRFNTRESTLRTSTRLLPSINACLWDDAADAFTEFVYGTGSIDGKPYQKALRGLLIRRLCEALLFLGLDWDDAVKDDDVALPSDRRQLANGSWRDKIRLAGKTKLSDVLPTARLHPLPDPSDLDLFESTQDDASVKEVAVGGDAQSTAQENPEQASATSGVVEAARPASELTQPAAPAAADSTKPIPTPIPPSLQREAAGVDQRAPPPREAPAASSSVVAGQDGTKPPSVWTRQPSEVEYKIDPNAGLKPIEDSDRGRAFVAQRVSVWVIRAGGTGLFGTGFKGASDWLQQDATLFATTMDLWVPAVLSGVTLAGGLVSKARADWRRAKANREASQGLY